MRPQPCIEIPTTIPYAGLSRCQPIGVPGRYSLTSAWTNAPGATPIHSETLSRSVVANAGSGPLENESHRSRRNASPPPERDSERRGVVAKYCWKRASRNGSPRNGGEHVGLLAAGKEFGPIDQTVR